MRMRKQGAVDYVLKPISPERLLQTCTRLQQALRQREQTTLPDGALDAALTQLRSLLGASAPDSHAPKLSVIQAGDALVVLMPNGGLGENRFSLKGSSAAIAEMRKSCR